MKWRRMFAALAPITVVAGCGGDDRTEMEGEAAEVVEAVVGLASDFLVEVKWMLGIPMDQDVPSDILDELAGVAEEEGVDPRDAPIRISPLDGDVRESLPRGVEDAWVALASDRNRLAHDAAVFRKLNLVDFKKDGESYSVAIGINPVDSPDHYNEYSLVVSRGDDGEWKIDRASGSSLDARRRR